MKLHILRGSIYKKLHFIYLPLHFVTFSFTYHLALIVKIKKGEIVNIIHSFDFDLINANINFTNNFLSVVFQD